MWPQGGRDCLVGVCREVLCRVVVMTHVAVLTQQSCETVCVLGVSVYGFEEIKSTDMRVLVKNL